MPHLQIEIHVLHPSPSAESKAKGYLLPDFYSGATGLPGRFSEGLSLRRLHVQRGRALGRTVGLGQPGIDNEPVAVLNHQVPHVSELGLLAGAFSKQSGVGIGRREMRGIRAFLAMEVARGVAPTATAAAISGRRRTAAILRHETLHAGPGLDQRAVDREVL